MTVGVVMGFGLVIQGAAAKAPTWFNWDYKETSCSTF